MFDAFDWLSKKYVQSVVQLAKFICIRLDQSISQTIVIDGISRRSQQSALVSAAHLGLDLQRLAWIYHVIRSFLLHRVCAFAVVHVRITLAVHVLIILGLMFKDLLKRLKPINVICLTTDSNVALLQQSVDNLLHIVQVVRPVDLHILIIVACIVKVRSSLVVLQLHV